MTIDPQKVIHAARNGIPLVIKTHSLPAQTEVDLEDILMIYLEELGQVGLKDHLIYCLKELTGNAKKANTKRVYFKEKGLRLDVPEDYEKGMKTFKSDTLSNIYHYLQVQEQEDLYIKIAFLIRNQTLYLNVRNNAAIAPSELSRVYDRIARARAFTSMEEVFEELLDETEGAGLGIAILILMLRKMGLSDKAFDINLVGTETSASVTIPMESIRFEQSNQIADELIQVVEDLPPFPENLEKLMRLLENPDVKFESIAAQLSRDPALTADLIKFINSAQFGQRKKIESLQDAVKIIGIQGLKDLVYPYGAQKVLAPYLAKQRHLWDNAIAVSYFAQELAKEFEFTRPSQSLAQIGGVLYNLGQILVSYLHPEVSRRILEFCQEKSFSISLFEELTRAINPADLGARVAEKWNFPPDLVQVIRFQNRPQGALPVLQPVACVIHLAGCLVSVEQNLLQYDQISPQVLNSLGVSDLAKLEGRHERMRSAYNTLSQAID